MPNTIKCPRCQCEVDVVSFAPGSTVRCADCGGMMRVPTGRTGVHPSVPAQSKGATTRTRAAAAGGGSGTRVRTRTVGAVEGPVRSRARMVPAKSNTGMYVLLGALVLAAIIVGAVMFLGGPKTEPLAPAPPPKPAVAKPPPPKPAPAPAPEPAPAPAPAPRPGDEASRFNWEETLKQLRGGGGFDVEGRPEQVYFERVKRLGKAAYPHLIRYIDHEDPGFGRAAVAVLNALTGQSRPLPNDASKAKLKAEWEEWLKSQP
jgi:hypothetical protein